MSEICEPDMVDFLVHSRIRIAAPPAAIWPHIAALAWMSAPKLVSIDGEPGSVGERFEAYHDPAMAVIAFLAVNAEVTPGVRRTLRIVGLDGVAMGFTSFEIIPSGEETIAMYDVTLRMPWPAGQPIEEALVAGQKGGDDALQQLKELVEG